MTIMFCFLLQQHWLTKKLKELNVIAVCLTSTKKELAGVHSIPTSTRAVTLFFGSTHNSLSLFCVRDKT